MYNAKVHKPTKKLKIALLCGGPSLERGISLNSARSVCDHLQSDTIDITPIYFDHKENPYRISRSQLYSNTPSDFDFKLHSTASALSRSGLVKLLKSVDLCFPAIHGAFGEDGKLQKFLEEHNIPFLGSGSETCRLCFHKYHANEFIRKAGFYAVPSALFMSHHTTKESMLMMKAFFKKHNIKRAIVKPARGGSSIGVHSVTGVFEAMQALHKIFIKRIDTQAVVEPFISGKEFTVIILQNRFGQPVAVLPTEIETDYSENQIFNYRRKYLPTRQVSYHCPPRFSKEIIEKIQTQAEQLFVLFGMRDFARFDGFLMEDGNIWFSDFNPISGMEQNSFLFQQSAQIGMSHEDLLNFVVKHASGRHVTHFAKQKELSVIFGGGNSERQVSLMSGTNAWLKLRRSEKLGMKPEPYLLDTEGNVWHLPYAYTLNHTVEEIMDMCKRAKKIEPFLKIMRKKVLDRLALLPGQANEPLWIPEEMTLTEFTDRAKYVFNGLHGGMGEDGTFQRLLTRLKIPYNGTKETGSRLCMNKYLTGEALNTLKPHGVYVPEKKLVPVSEFGNFKRVDYVRFWKELKQELSARSIIVKPPEDGCSYGIVHLASPSDLEKYILILKKGVKHIPPQTFHLQHDILEMPIFPPEKLLFEKFIVTDEVRVLGNRLHWKTKSDWIEITCGVLGPEGKMKAFQPSVTIAFGQVLSLEEKFQGGTGVNITPPPQPFVKKQAVSKAMKRIELVANTLGLAGYGRVDAFMHVKTGELYVIEVNTLPALTPSTVLFQQALAEHPPIPPRELLEKIVELSKY